MSPTNILKCMIVFYLGNGFQNSVLKRVQHSFKGGYTQIRTELYIYIAFLNYGVRNGPNFI